MLTHEVTDKERVEYIRKNLEQDLALRDYHPTIYWRLKENLKLLDKFNGMVSDKTISSYKSRIRDFFYGDNYEELSE